MRLPPFLIKRLIYVWSVLELDKRKITQIFAAITMNANFKGFAEGQIYRGDSKKLCVPVLNCYSCPGALGSCPIGALQAVAGSISYKISLYVIGFLSLIGILFGRLICAWICPFGLIQELLHKISGRKLKANPKADNVLRYVKYGVLFTAVLLLPALLADQFGLSTPYFCEYICPAGTLEGGIPLVLMNGPLQNAIGALFSWKMFLLIATVLFSILIYRPFCKYVCPLGAFYAFFNRISFYRYEVDKSKCTQCGVCSKKCKMGIEVYKKPNHAECIRCGDCIRACPAKAIIKGFHFSGSANAQRRNAGDDIAAE